MASLSSPGDDGVDLGTRTTMTSSGGGELLQRAVCPRLCHFPSPTTATPPADLHHRLSVFLPHSPDHTPSLPIYMSKQSSLLRVVCVLVLLLQPVLAGDQQLLAQIGDEFLCQDPVKGPGSLMLNHVGDELNSDRAAAPGEEAFFSDDEYGGEEDSVGDGHAMDPDRSVDGEEYADKEEDEEDSLLGGQGAVSVATEGSNDSEELGSGGGDVQCPECGKHFRSNKSMFGHLRSHPDRGYKGATPPPAKPRLLSPPVDTGRPVASQIAQDQSVNVKREPHDQSVNVKREPDVPEEEDSVVSKAGDDVVLRDDRGNTVHPSEDGNSVTMMAIEDKAPCSEVGSSVAEMAVGNPGSSQGSSIAVDAPTKRRKSKEAHRKEKDVASATKARRPYICKHCQTVFPTHQALGGHMAAHNKDRRVQAQNDQAAWEAHHQGKSSLNRQELKGGGEEGEQRGGGLSASARALLMERYTRLFNTGWQSRQETGGYKRQHTGSEAGGSLPPVAPPVTDGDQHRLFGVDLNVQAPGKE
uniref:Uncharacterized protein n=1 Tax=Avena sativa TaxID=4498 RepID=A0ACD5ZS87_AVESA